VLPSALIAEPLRDKPGTMNGLQRSVALKAMHAYGRDAVVLGHDRFLVVTGQNRN
jgi:hypothetical protein